MRHKYRQLRFLENLAGGAAEDHLAQPALGIGALDDQIGAPAAGFGQDRLADPALLRLGDARRGGDAAAAGEREAADLLRAFFRERR